MNDLGAGKPRTRAQERLHSRYGPRAVVTGASDGIGREFAFRLAEAGVNIVLVARRRPLLDAIAAELARDHGVECRVLEIDLSRENGAAAVDEATGDLDVGLLVAAAGFGTSGSFIESNLDVEIEMLNVNCRALLCLSWSFGRRLAQRRRGGIVLMSSLVALQGAPKAANYAATKSYVQTLAEGLHVELAPLGVDVLASAPGPVHSGFASRAGMRMTAALRPKQVAQATLNALGRKTTVVPGLLSQFLTYSLAPLPRVGRTRIMGQVMKGMTKHQEKTS